MLSRLSCVVLFATLWTVAHQVSLSIEFSRQEYWSGLPCLPPGDLPDVGIEPVSLMSSALAGGFSTISTTWEVPQCPAAAAAAKSLQSCPTLCDPIDGCPPGSCPWDSPGKNTGVGCHFLLQCIKVKSESEVAQSCPTLSDPMDCSLPGSSTHGIF